MKINISDIKINHRKRAADSKKVKQLADSIERLGLLQPIIMGKDNVLISGLHRIEAYKLLGYKKIETEIKDFDEIKKKLAEIDENLCRAELSILEQGEQLLQRDKLLSDLGIRAGNGRPRKGEKGEFSSPFLTTAMIASEAGLSERVAEQRKQIAKNISIKVKDKLRGTIYSNNAHGLMQLARQPEHIQKLAVQNILTDKVSTSIKNEPNVIKVAIQEAHREYNLKKSKKKTNNFNIPDSVKLHCGDFRKICNEMPPDSCDLILCDPLYFQKAVNLYRDLGDLAMRVLKPSSFFISYVGTMFLPDVLNHLTGAGLKYYWLGTVKFSKGRNTEWNRRVWSHVKYFVIFYKEPINRKAKFFEDYLISPRLEKDYHVYQQTIDVFSYLISRFSQVGDIVLDPVCGSATTALSALTEKRKCIAIDEDPKAIRVAKNRIAEYLETYSRH